MSRGQKNIPVHQFFKEPSHTDVHEPTVKIGEHGFIEFSQSQINRDVNSGKLNNIKIKYNGLCEIICNYVLLEDMLGENNPLPLQTDVTANWLNTNKGDEKLALKFKDDTEFVARYKNKYGDKITIENLKKVENTHILDVTSFFSHLLALFFSIYPCNIFSNAPFAKLPFTHTKSDSGETQTLVDQEMLSERLSQLENGFYIKFFAFKKHGLSMDGHSMLIKKIDDNTYSFFDPNHGEYTNLGITELAEKINKSTREHNANHMAFLDARAFLNSYQIREKNDPTSPKFN